MTFKPNTDDIREAPTLTIIPSLQSRGAEVRIMDPKGKGEGTALLPDAMWFDDPYDGYSQRPRPRGDFNRME